MGTGAVANFSTDNFSRFVGVSVLFHIAIVLVFTVKTVFFPSEEIQIRNAIRVDIVGLPDKKVAPKPKAEKAKPKKAKVKPAKTKDKKSKNSKKVDLKKAKNKQNKALERLKALQAIEKSQKDTKTKPKVEPTKEFKGNVVNAGDSLTGLDRLDHNQYFSTLKGHVQKHFVLPQWLAESEFRAKALVKVDERGFVISRELTESSGNPTFDNRVLEAIDNASPFPPPPGRLKNVIALNGLVFNFPD